MSVFLHLLVSCYPTFPVVLEGTFPDNPKGDYDGDNLTEQEGDCDDLDPNVGLPRTWYVDSDSDGFGDNGGLFNH